MRLQTGNESYILSSGLNDAQINQIEQPRKKYLRPEEEDGSICHLLQAKRTAFYFSKLFNRTQLDF